VPHPIGWYDTHAPDLVRTYELADPAKLHDWLKGLISETPGTVLDIGAGPGRDAAWFAGQGHDVIAVEPSAGMRSEGQRFHVDPRIRWMDDQEKWLTDRKMTFTGYQHFAQWMAILAPAGVSAGASTLVTLFGH
jgi:SAM-dependent methyltransferase